MRALSLFIVLVLGKVVILFGRDVPFTLWSPLAYLWQDLLVVMIFLAIDRIVRRPWFGWSLYTLMVIYMAINVPLIRVLSTPLTWPMLRATSTTLSDSIMHYVTAQNLVLMAVILLASCLVPLLSHTVAARYGNRIFRFAWARKVFRNDWTLRALTIGIALIMIALGPSATARFETIGMHRNFLLALVTSTLPRLPAKPAEEDWRASLTERSRGEDLSQLRGVAAGRNVVMVLLESTGAQYLHPYGATNDPMPNLTRLAQESILFESAYTVYPESIKGLFAVLSSIYPSIDSKPEVYSGIGGASIASVLAGVGYRTGLFHSGRFMYLGMDAVIQNRGFGTMEDAGDIAGNHNSSFGVDELSTVNRMLSWIDSLPAGQQFFITYLPIAGHHPYDSPEPGPFPENNDLGRYLNALHYGDAALGEFFQALRARGLEQNTLFIIFGDHGEAFGQHQGNYGHTLFIYEENIHVPYLIAAPGLLKKQIRVRGIASLIDTAPTICDLLGLPAPGEYQGKSLLSPDDRMALFFTDYSLGYLGLRDHHRKFIYEVESERSKLFDLCSDPEEKTNLAGQFPELVSEYERHLRRWCAAQRYFVRTHTSHGRIAKINED